MKRELESMKKFTDVPLMTRRQDCFKENALDELQEVYGDVKVIEESLSKTVNMAEFIIQKH